MADDLLLDSFSQDFLCSLYRWSSICPLQIDGYFTLGAHFSNPSVENSSEGCPRVCPKVQLLPKQCIHILTLKPDSLQKMTEREVLGRKENEDQKHQKAEGQRSAGCRLALGPSDQACSSFPCQTKPNPSAPCTPAAAEPSQWPSLVLLA